MTQPEPRRFIRDNLRLQLVPAIPEIRLYTAHPGSGLGRLLDRDNQAPPYWAYCWAGGTVLARHVLESPECIAGRRVIDLGTGSGLAAIAAAMSGARQVTAVDTDPLAVIAAGLNAEANDIVFASICADILDEPPPDADLILAGDVFYSSELARRVLPFLRRCRDAGMEVLIGDPGRRDLPLDALISIAEYPVPDFGNAGDRTEWKSSVYVLAP